MNAVMLTICEASRRRCCVGIIDTIIGLFLSTTTQLEKTTVVHSCVAEIFNQRLLASEEVTQRQK